MNVERNIMPDSSFDHETRVLGPKPPVVPTNPPTISLSGQGEGANESLLGDEQERARQTHVKALESVWGEGNVGGAMTQEQKIQARLKGNESNLQKYNERRKRAREMVAGVSAAVEQKGAAEPEAARNPVVVGAAATTSERRAINELPANEEPQAVEPATGTAEEAQARGAFLGALDQRAAKLADSELAKAPPAPPFNDRIGKNGPSAAEFSVNPKAALATAVAGLTASPSSPDLSFLEPSRVPAVVAAPPSPSTHEVKSHDDPAIVQPRPVSVIAPDGVVPFPNITSEPASRRESWWRGLWPFGRKSAPASPVIPPVPAVTGTVSSQKPTEPEYSDNLRVAADDLTKFRNSLGQNRARLDTLQPKPPSQGKKDKSHPVRKAVIGTAVGAGLALGIVRHAGEINQAETNPPTGRPPGAYIVPPPDAGALASEAVIEDNLVTGVNKVSIPKPPQLETTTITSVPGEEVVKPTEPTEELPATAEAPKELTLEEFVNTKTREVVIVRGSSISDAMQRAGIMNAETFNELIYTKPDAALGAFILAYPELVAANPNIPPLHEVVLRYSTLNDVERQAMLKELADWVNQGKLDLVYPTEDTKDVTGPSLTVPVNGEAARWITEKAIQAAVSEEPKAWEEFEKELRTLIKEKEERENLERVARNAINQARDDGVIS